MSARALLIVPKVGRTMVGIVLLCAFSLGALAAHAPKSSALSGSDFQAGHIIDDGVFTNSSSMTVNDIQNFLNSKVPSCDTNGSQLSSHPNSSGGYYTRAQWTSLYYYGRSDGRDSSGNPIQFTCLRNYVENTNTLENNLWRPGASIPGGISAAQIIYNAAQAYQISPEVILTTIQKEQGSVTDDWPWNNEFFYAMGYSCPDTAAGCSSNYADFYKQIDGGTWQFRYYLNHPYAFNYWIGNYYVQYNPNSGCGGSIVNIQNAATAALYIYTPYQPNQAALNNLTGSGDSCSSYGNRNFWYYFSTWFGSTFAPTAISNINWQFESLDGSSAALSRSSGQFGLYSNTITVGSVLHVFYYDATNGDLRHAWNDSNGWHFETVDGEGGANGQSSGNVGGFPKAVVYNGQLNVAYYDFQNHGLRLAALNGSTWTAQALDGAGTGRSSDDVGQDITITPFQNTLQIFYSDITAGNLRHAWSDSNGWHFENLDGDVGSISHYSSNVGQGAFAGVINNSDLQLFYYDVQKGNLRHAWSDSNGWHFENLDGDVGSISHYSGNVGAFPTFTFTGGGIQMFYYDVDRQVLRHAWTNGTGWHFENLDGDVGSISHYSGNVGAHPFTILVSSTLNVFYANSSTRGLRQAYTDPSTGAWRFADIDGAPDAISKSTDELDSAASGALYGTSAQVYYFDTRTNTLQHAWGPLK